MELPDSKYKMIVKLCEYGDQLIEKKKYVEAIKEYDKALKMIPRSVNDWEASTWIYTAIGDAYYLLGDFIKAKEAFYDARNCPDGIANPYILLRLGQSLYECEDLEKAKEFLLRAYMVEGVDIYKDEDDKYLDLIRDII